MDIHKLEYFIAIVENDFNMSEAARSIHISQPALSRFISTYEQNYNKELFNRKNGRLIGLTNLGEHIYFHAKKVMSAYDLMQREVNELMKYDEGTIRIGIPPIILSILMTKFLSRIKEINLHFDISIKEVGSFDIESEFNQGKIDFGMMMAPNKMDVTLYKEHTIFKEELVAFVHEDNPLYHDINRIRWGDLDKAKISLLDDSFMINQLIQAKLIQYNVNPRIDAFVSSWDFLLEMARVSNILTILPETIHRVARLDKIKTIRFIDPLYWEVVVLYRNKTTYSNLEQYFITTMLDYFNYHEDINKVKPYIT